jgi:branched-chain amino acid transport system ATP-binding protein
VTGRPALLETKALSKRFGSLIAVKDVSLSIAKGEIHAIIGPNGAGKTTLLDLLSGELPASGGSLHFDGHEVTGRSPDQLAKTGIGRSFQHSSVFESLSVFENVRLAVQTQFPKAFGFFRSSESYSDVKSRVLNILQELSLDSSRDAYAGELSHGEQRQLEIGMLMAISPKLMLLDEPTSGMGRNESLELISILRRLSLRHTLVLVEHDMEVVFELADRITVLVNGAVLASGTPQAVRADSAVRTAYLGQDG